MLCSTLLLRLRVSLLIAWLGVVVVVCLIWMLRFMLIVRLTRLLWFMFFVDVWVWVWLVSVIAILGSFGG